MKHPEELGNPAVLGVGNALVDIMISLPDDEPLRQFQLPRGSMTLVNSTFSKQIYESTRPWQKNVTTGGSAANTIHTLACLGGTCGYAGKIGQDELGAIFSSEFKNRNIRNHLTFSSQGTGRVMAMVSPDSERTMATFLGAAADLQPEEFPAEIFRDYQYLYIEGYLVQNHELIETIVKNAHQAGLKVAVDLSSYNIVTENLGFLKSLVSRFVDIVFANEEEAFAYTGLQPDEAVKAIAAECELAVVKTGRQGSLVKSGESMAVIAPVPTTAVDTTGAGDSYAAGFLYGLTKGLTLQQCGDIASLVSSKAVETLGAKIPDVSWPGLLETVKKIENQ